MSGPATEDRELRALTRSIEWIDGTAFFFVVVEDRSQRELILRRIQQELPTRRIRLVSVTRTTSNLLDQLRTLPPFNQRDALFVVGLEKTIRNQEDTSAPIIAISMLPAICSGRFSMVRSYSSF